MKGIRCDRCHDDEKPLWEIVESNMVVGYICAECLDEFALLDKVIAGSLGSRTETVALVLRPTFNQRIIVTGCPSALDEKFAYVMGLIDAAPDLPTAPQTALD